MKGAQDRKWFFNAYEGDPATRNYHHQYNPAYKYWTKPSDRTQWKDEYALYLDIKRNTGAHDIAIFKLYDGSDDDKLYKIHSDPSQASYMKVWGGLEWQHLKDVEIEQLRGNPYPMDKGITKTHKLDKSYLDSFSQSKALSAKQKLVADSIQEELVTIIKDCKSFDTTLLIKYLDSKHLIDMITKIDLEELSDCRDKIKQWIADVKMDVAQVRQMTSKAFQLKMVKICGDKKYRGYSAPIYKKIQETSNLMFNIKNVEEFTEKFTAFANTNTEEETKDNDKEDNQGSDEAKSIYNNLIDCYVRHIFALESESIFKPDTNGNDVVDLNVVGYQNNELRVVDYTLNFGPADKGANIDLNLACTNIMEPYIGGDLMLPIKTIGVCFMIKHKHLIMFKQLLKYVYIGNKWWSISLSRQRKRGYTDSCGNWCDNKRRSL